MVRLSWKPEPSFVKWAHRLPAGRARRHGLAGRPLCLFNNAAVGMVRQVTHNVRGHGAYLLGQTHRRALWYYFPLLLTIKLTLSLLIPLVVVLLLRPRALLDWVFLAGAVVLLLSPAFRVQIGIRMILPVVALCVVGLSAALVEPSQATANRWRHRGMFGIAGIAPCGAWSRPCWSGRMACATSTSCGAAPRTATRWSAKPITTGAKG